MFNDQIKQFGVPGMSHKHLTISDHGTEFLHLDAISERLVLLSIGLIHIPLNSVELMRIQMA